MEETDLLPQLAISGSAGAGIALAVVGGFLLLLFAAALLEKRLTEPYVLIGEDSRLPAYVTERGKELRRQGFEYGGVLGHAKMRITATTWLSRDRSTLALTGAGTVAAVPTQQTWLFTPLSDGRFLVTTDRNDEGDPSGQQIIRRRLNSSLPDLIKLHEKRKGRYAEDVCSFPEPSPLDALLAIYTERVARLIEQGRARYIDDERQYWRYTPAGAFRVCGGFFGQLLDALRQFWRV